MLFWTFVSLLLAAGENASAQQAPRLSLPIACTPGTDCWIANYVDMDPQPDAIQDPLCGALTYDGHKGTDFAVRDWAAMEQGIDVLAAADGSVLRTRDGMPDAVRSRGELRRIMKSNRACGNGVVLQHGGSWQTMYCHMKQHSIAVSEGESVRAGQKLGEVGHSGFVEFPHLHLGLMDGSSPVDPFTGRDNGAGCRAGGNPLWAVDLPYQPVSLYAAGFHAGEPDFDAIQRDADSPASLPVMSPALTFWVAYFGARVGDRLHLEIHGPDGSVFAERDVVSDQNRARQFYFVGRRARAGLQPGTYSGTVTVSRTEGPAAPFTREVSRTLDVH